MVPPAAVTPPGRKNPLYQKLSSRLKKARKAAGLTPTRLSLLAGLSNPAATQLEAGGQVPRVDTIERLARVLGVEACWLGFGVEGKRPFEQKIKGGRPADGSPIAQEAPDGPLSCADLPARLIAARAARGLTRKALGAAAEISGQGVAYIEAGRSIPSVATVEALAAALGVSPCWLAYGQGQGPQE